ncbi:nuclear transport factor 2 family protein [Microbacterium atlanticum]|uniref:nuclear transport factor 2 family protein n=1 Tax=Microbacterium atlanticum TaxID=2782168 RepID=UPI001888ED93|nr:nuclear transport factor 2 family protein [Microbacterium atlanticum]
MYIEKLREMFENVSIARDAARFGEYFHPDLQLSFNGQVQDFEVVRSGHEAVYERTIETTVEFDEEAWVESPDGVAGRFWLTTTRVGEAPRANETLFVVKYRDGLIVRMWELVWAADPADARFE